MKRRLLRVVLWTGIAFVIAVLGGGLWFRGQLLDSLPLLDGEISLPGVEGPVVVERDALGVPTLRGESRVDLAAALGFLHAQDRFFQMDLLRRGTAGELAELLGPAVAQDDADFKPHRLRHHARLSLERLPLEDRALLDAYTQGVNAGLEALAAPPFEYLLLRQDPVLWRPEDSMLGIMGYFMLLQNSLGRHEERVGMTRDLLPRPLFEFLVPKSTQWEAPLIGIAGPPPPIPSPEVWDYRRDPPMATPTSEKGEENEEEMPQVADRLLGRTLESLERPLIPGSNAMAVAASHGKEGVALLANDMHLGLDVPNTWYRAAFSWPGEGGEGHEVFGVTLPGLPLMVVGSNRHIAWGFTNSRADTVDLVLLEVDPSSPNTYRTPDGPREFEHGTAVVKVRGEADRDVEFRSTIYGPVIGEDHLGRPWALKWVALEPEATNLLSRGLETARTVEEALDVATISGIPAQNFLVADDSGRIGWTLIGRLPRRVGFSGRFPTSWADGEHSWDGLLPPAEVPRLVDPPQGKLWSANQRSVTGEDLAKIGEGGFDTGARAWQLRQGMLRQEKLSHQDLLDIMLDDRAVFLERYHDLLLDLLTPEALEGRPQRQEFRRLVESWGGRAAVDSVGFRLVRGFRQVLSRQVLVPLIQVCRDRDPTYEYHGTTRETDQPLWSLVQERPAHFLDPRFESWNEALLAAVDTAIELLLAGGRPLSELTWGEYNRAEIKHPFSHAMPFLGRWLDMPSEALPGADYMPRSQHSSGGATQRMVVSPGREEEGLFHMPGGQSGHPLSPHYGDSHEAWAQGRPTPFLPGETVHTLVLRPPEGR